MAALVCPPVYLGGHAEILSMSSWLHQEDAECPVLSAILNYCEETQLLQAAELKDQVPVGCSARLPGTWGLRGHLSCCSSQGTPEGRHEGAPTDKGDNCHLLGAS